MTPHPPSLDCPPVAFVCVECDATFYRNGKGRPPLYCTGLCKNRAYDRRRKLKRTQERVEP